MQSLTAHALGCAAALVVTFSAASAAAGPEPRLDKTHPVAWWFAYKFNAATAPNALSDPARDCTFGGGQPYQYKSEFSQTYAVASAADPTLKAGPGLIGVGEGNPVGATFAQIYNGAVSYVVWNDQFKDHPMFPGCSAFCGAPWAHAKGVIAWDDNGEGVVLQVTTPSWPGSGSKAFPRQGDLNTLGCVTNNNLLYAQHFFAVKLSRADTAAVLRAARNAGLPTIPNEKSIVFVRPGSPSEINALVAELGDKTPSNPKVVDEALSTRVRVISKPAALAVPPWQLVSAELDGEPLRVASWWVGDEGFPSTNAGKPGCWDTSLGTPGRVEIAMTGRWNGKTIALNGGNNPLGNHAKVGVSLPGGKDYAIFGDMNQTGGLKTACTVSQNPRGGLFFVVQDSALAASVRDLLAGQTAANGDRTVGEGAAKWTPRARHRHR